MTDNKNNTKKRTIVASDIHGRFDLFQKMLDEMQLTKNDTLILLGDYIDRGNQSYEVIKKIQELQSKFNVIALKGNHEVMMINALKEVKSNKSINNMRTSFYNLSMWGGNGGYNTLDSFDSNNADTQDELDWLESLPLKYEDDYFHYVHAGFEPKVEIENQTESAMLWSREEFIYNNYDFGKPVIFGHTVHKEVTDYGNKIAIDTGAVFYGKLSVLEIVNGEIRVKEITMD